MNTHLRLRAIALLLAIALASIACSSTDTSASDTDTNATSTADPAVDPSTADPTVDEAADPAVDEAAGVDETSTEAVVTGFDASLFLDGAIVGDPVIEDCVLSDGSASECYTVTVVGTPVDQAVGPFCPTDVTDDAEAGGLWLDGEHSFVIDGEFFTELAEIYGDDLWNNIVNDDGSINVIDSAEEFQVAARPDITEEYYYHCVDGNVEWLDGGEQPEHTIQIPATPSLAAEPTVQFATGAHSTLGVTLNGALLSGSADMDAILASYTIAAFDDCGGHINPALGYHVHGTTGCSDIGEATDGETPPFAYAIDGHTVHAPHDDADAVVLDECNGHTSDEYGYHYHAASVEQNATLTCLYGLTVEGQDTGGRPPGGARPEGREDPPDEG